MSSGIYKGRVTPRVIAVSEDSSGLGGPGAAAVTVGGLQVITTAGFTRPADTATYAALDSVSNSTSAPTIMTFANAARVSGGSGMIISARHNKNSTTVAAASFRLWLYRATIAAVNDNAPLALLYANRANRIGFIDFTHMAGGSGGDSSSALTTYVGLPFVLTSGTSLFGRAQALAGYVPTSAEQHEFELTISQN